jgi:Mg-chelatase subunit ChlD
VTLITINDLRRALLNGGDVFVFSDLYARALEGSPIPIISHFDAPCWLPSPSLLVDQVDSRFVASTPPLEPLPFFGQALSAALDVTTVDLPLYEIHRGETLARVIASLQPDVIGLDCSPAELAVHISYAFSMSCAVGLPARFEIVYGPSAETRFSGLLRPANTGVMALLESWIGRIPLLPFGRPLLRGRGTSSDEARYVASRTVDVARYSAALGRKVRLLTIVVPEHAEDLERTIAALRQGSDRDLYLPAEVDCECSQSFFVGECLDVTDGSNSESQGGTPLAQERFRAAFDGVVAALTERALSASDAMSLVAQMVGRTRRHRDIVRGASVRGTIAVTELLDSLSLLNGGPTPGGIIKAALIALPPRILVKPRTNGVAVIDDIAKEVLYGVRFTHEDEKTIETFSDTLSADVLPPGADRISSARRPPDPSAGGHTESFAVVPDSSSDATTPDHPHRSNLPPPDRRNDYTTVKQAVMRLLGDLDDRLRAGTITADEYERSRAGLMARLEKAARAQLGMSGRELAGTIMEMMDAQDGQWNNEVSLSRMRAYYHVKGACEGAEISPLKQDYHALKWLIDDLQSQQVLRATADASEFALTGFALDTLLKHLVGDKPILDSTLKTSVAGAELSSYRAHEVRRFSQGDTFRYVSVRHTLREVARRRKELFELTGTDLRVFLKERRKPQIDLVLCIDISGSMGFRQKLVYARLVAAGLVAAAFHEGNRAGVVAFNDHGQTTVPLTGRDRDSLFNGIAGLTPRGNTNIGDGIRSASDLLLQGHIRNRKHLVLISDGQASAMSSGAFAHLSPVKGQDLTEEAALYEVERASAAGVHVSVVHIAGRDDADDLFIKTIARAGRGTVRRLVGLADIRAMLRR